MPRSAAAMISSGVSPARLANSVPLRLATRGTDWQWPGTRAVAVHLDETAAPDLDRRGRPLLDDDPLILANAWWEPAASASRRRPPGGLAGRAGHLRPRRTTPVAAGDSVTVGPRSLTVLCAPRSPTRAPPLLVLHTSARVLTPPWRRQRSHQISFPQRGRIHRRRTGWQGRRTEPSGQRRRGGDDDPGAGGVWIVPHHPGRGLRRLAVPRPTAPHPRARGRAHARRRRLRPGPRSTQPAARPAVRRSGGHARRGPRLPELAHRRALGGDPPRARR